MMGNMKNEIRIRYGGAALLSLIVVMMMALACGADSYTPDNPDVVARLYALYPNARDVSWSKVDGSYVADCWDGDNQLEVWIGEDAQWIMTGTTIFRSQLPASVNTTFTESEYADKTIVSIVCQTYPSEPGMLYVIKVKDGNGTVTLYFSEYGDLVKVG
jgi:hypothetical protein